VLEDFPQNFDATSVFVTFAWLNFNLMNQEENDTNFRFKFSSF
jgi:hypothetical protein